MRERSSTCAIDGDALTRGLPADDTDDVDSRFGRDDGEGFLAPSSSNVGSCSTSVRGVSGIDDKPEEDEAKVESEGRDESVELSHRACKSLLSGVDERENDGGDAEPS